MLENSALVGIRAQQHTARSAMHSRILSLKLRTLARSRKTRRFNNNFQSVCADRQVHGTLALPQCSVLNVCTPHFLPTRVSPFFTGSCA